MTNVTPTQSRGTESSCLLCAVTTLFLLIGFVVLVQIVKENNSSKTQNVVEIGNSRLTVPWGLIKIT